MELCDDIGQVGEGKAPSFAAGIPEWGVGGGVSSSGQTPVVASK